VAKNIEQFPEKYKVQAGGRALNLFYLTEQQRRRIEKSPNGFSVVDSDIQFTTVEMDAELHAHPERFSPNVILRPVFQESILPNIAFVGGGGELAYWLELKEVFAQANVFYPMLILRNSFAITFANDRMLMEKLRLSVAEIFKPANLLMADWVKKESELRVDLAEEKLQLEKLYQQIQQVATAVDPSLGTHSNTLYHRALAKIEALEKKMLRAEKRKYATQQRQIEKLKASLFPNNGLQERVENFMRIYAAFGAESLDRLYASSLTTEQLFTVVHW
jgi:bacillithiol biosynthesis cysteine-adding enzyme BshC